MKYTDFVNKAINIANNYKTLYVMGCFGAPMTDANKSRYANNHEYNKQTTRTQKIQNASSDTFGFDCVCLIKGILWGWSGDKSKTYGGAEYASNGVPDVGADAIMNHCSNVSTDFKTIQEGEIVHMTGHVGIYIGNGLVVECTPIWEDGVQITACGNIGSKSGHNTRTWTNHGKLKYIDYTKDTNKTIDQIANEVLEGKWGNGSERKTRLVEAGYDYNLVQAKVNQIVHDQKIEEVAKQVINGKYGNGQARKEALTKAGYDYVEVQQKVNELLKKS